MSDWLIILVYFTGMAQGAWFYWRWDFGRRVKLTNARLRQLAAKYPPPQSWYAEDAEVSP